MHNRYATPESIIAGITMKDSSEPESNNMALHACINMESIRENRRKLAAFLNCSLKDLVYANQCHSTNWYKAVPADRGRGSDTMVTAIPDTDAIFTFEPNLLLCCFTADCVPLILYHERAGLVGVIHSGWEGTVKEITPKVLQHLQEIEGCSNSDTRVVIGPAISQERFEVDRDVYDRFKSLGYAENFMSYTEQTRKYHIDNQMIVKRQCELQGIPSDQITVDRTCTYNSPNCFSYRQDKNCGRHMSFVMRKR